MGRAPSYDFARFSQEVESQLPWFLKAVEQIKERVPDVRLVVAAFKESQAEFAREQIAAADLNIEVYTSRTPNLCRQLIVWLFRKCVTGIDVLSKANGRTISHE